MKLTDANKLRDYVKEQINQYGKPFDGSAYEFGLKIMHYIDNMSTDYDIEKVVEQLSKLPQYKLDLADAMIDTLENRRYRHFVCLEDVTEIVKQGGISDDVCEWEYNDTEYDWESSCEHLHIFMSDGPKENEYRFCPYCGKKIEVVE